LIAVQIDTDRDVVMERKQGDCFFLFINRRENEEDKSNVTEMAYALGVICIVSAKVETQLFLVIGVSWLGINRF